MLKLSYKIDLSGPRAVLATAPERIYAAMGRARDIAMLIVEAAVKKNIGSSYESKPPAVCFGFLVNGVFGEPVQGSLGTVTGFVGVNPPADTYALPVETGSRAHFPPIDALILWVQKKFGISDPKAAKSAAFAVARKISQKGTEGHFMFQRAWESTQSDVEQAFDDELDVEVAAINSGGQA